MAFSFLDICQDSGRGGGRYLPNQTTTKPTNMKKFTVVLSLLVLIATSLVAFKPLSSTEGVTLIVSHDVKDFATWKKAFDTDAKVRKEMGLETEAVYTNAEKPNEVTIVFHATSVEVVKGMVGSAQLKEKMAAAGVISAPVTKMLHKQ